MTRLFQIYCVIFVFGVCDEQTTNAQEADAAMREFKSDAPVGWERISGAYSTTQYVATTQYSVTRANGARDSLTNSVTCRHNGDCASLVGSLDLNFAERIERKAICTNSKYGFEITDRLGTNSWRLDQTSFANDEAFKILYSNWLVIFNPATMIDNPNYNNLSTFISDPDTSFERTERKGSLFKVHYSTKQKLLNGKAEPRNGTFEMDTEHDWRVVAHTFQRTKNNFISSTSLTYQSGGSGHLVEKIETNTKGFNGETHTVIAFDQYGKCESPVSEFRLTHFGLPEPQGVVWEKPTPRYIYWMIAVIFCVVTAIICRSYSRRVKSPTS